MTRTIGPSLTSSKGFQLNQVNKYKEKIRQIPEEMTTTDRFAQDVNYKNSLPYFFTQWMLKILMIPWEILKYAYTIIRQRIFKDYKFLW